MKGCNMFSFKYVLIALSLLALAFCACKKETVATETQPETITIAGYTYEKVDGDWYHVQNGQRGDRAIIQRLIVVPKLNVNLSSFDYSSLGLPNLPFEGPIISCFYVLDMSQLENPIDAAKRLWNTGSFEYLQFDAMGERL